MTAPGSPVFEVTIGKSCEGIPVLVSFPLRVREGVPDLDSQYQTDNRDLCAWLFYLGMDEHVICDPDFFERWLQEDGKDYFEPQYYVYPRGEEVWDYCISQSRELIKIINY